MSKVIVYIFFSISLLILTSCSYESNEKQYESSTINNFAPNGVSQGGVGDATGSGNR